MKSRVHCIVISLIISVLFNPSVYAKDSLFSSFPDSEGSKEKFRHFDEYSLVVGKKKNGYLIKNVSGKVIRKYFKIPTSYSESNILNNYLKEIKDNQGEILFLCKGDVACGNYNFLKKTIKPLKNIGHQNSHLVTAKLTKLKQVFYISAYIHSSHLSNYLQLDIIEVKDEPFDLLKFNNNYVINNSASKKFMLKQTEKDRKGSTDHPLVSRLPGSNIRKYKSFGFDKNLLVNGFVDRKYNTIAVEGKTTFIGYRVPREYSEHEAIKNYQAAFNRAGFKNIFECTGKQCGSEDKMYKAVNAMNRVGTVESQRYFLTKLERPTGNIWASVYVLGTLGGLSANLHIVEESSLNDNRLSVDVEAIHKGIELNGHVALDGLLFKYDSDQIQKESFPVLSQIAQYINGNPKKLFYVVGHTDDKGSRAYNTTLSNQRAKKVIAYLIKHHAVAKKQVGFEGAGEYSPIASNINELGRQKNRRVELVLRSDDL